jgi:hypothetical protein
MVGDVASIGNYAFRGCGSLESITLPGTVGTIGTNAFQNCISLGSIVLPSSLGVINADTFNGCTSLRWVKWPVSGNNAHINSDTSFGGCTALERIELPNNLRTGSSAAIPASAFANLSSLKTVIINTAGAPNLANANAFEGTHDGLAIYVPDGSVTTYQNGTNWTDLSDKIVSINGLGDEAPANW